MPAPLEVRVLEGVLRLALTAGGANVPTDNGYRRDVLTYDPERDGKPAVVVARTPGRPVVGPTPKLSWQEWVFPVTALLLDSAGGQVKASDAQEWRAAWPLALAEAVGGPSPLRVVGDPESVTEVHYINNDPLTVLDLSAFQQAGLWQSAVPLLVTVRVPY